MKSLIVALGVLVSSTAAHAFIQTHNVKGCNFWSYSTEARGYVCSSPDMSVRVADGFDVDRAITTLEMKIRELETRIQILEAKP